MEISGLRCREPKKVVQNLFTLLVCEPRLAPKLLKRFCGNFFKSSNFKLKKINEIMDVERNGMFLTPFHSEATMPQPLNRICT